MVIPEANFNKSIINDLIRTFFVLTLILITALTIGILNRVGLTRSIVHVQNAAKAIAKK